MALPTCVSGLCLSGALPLPTLAACRPHTQRTPPHSTPHPHPLVSLQAHFYIRAIQMEQLLEQDLEQDLRYLRDEVREASQPHALAL